MLRPPPGSERARVIGLLDAFQAAERAGVEAVGRWIVACADARLRGGLRVIRARDRRHAALAEARLRSLGGGPRARPSRGLAPPCGGVAGPGGPGPPEPGPPPRRLATPRERPPR